MGKFKTRITELLGIEHPILSDGSHQFRPAEPLHAAAQDGVLDAQQLRDSGFKFSHLNRLL